MCYAGRELKKKKKRRTSDGEGLGRKVCRRNGRRPRCLGVGEAWRGRATCRGSGQWATVGDSGKEKKLVVWACGFWWWRDTGGGVVIGEDPSAVSYALLPVLYAVSKAKTSREKSGQDGESMVLGILYCIFCFCRGRVLLIRQLGE